MKQISIFFLSLSVLVGCNKKEPIVGETEFQKSLNAYFKDASTSPLRAKDLKNFSNLNFFKVDSAFVVEAILTKTPNTNFTPMKTTTDSVSLKRVYGLLHFKLKGKNYQLNVYQDKAVLEANKQSDYLFLPFLDQTNGSSTYSGGRYIDLSIPDNSSKLTIDFNKAYNPYCAYNEAYSCPIVPRQNYLPVKIEAGVKDFVKANE